MNILLMLSHCWSHLPVAIFQFSGIGPAIPPRAVAGGLIGASIQALLRGAPLGAYSGTKPLLQEQTRAIYRKLLIATFANFAKILFRHRENSSFIVRGVSAANGASQPFYFSMGVA